MKFYHYFPSVTFVVLTVDQFIGRDESPLEQQIRSRRDVFVEEIAHFL